LFPFPFLIPVSVGNINDLEAKPGSANFGITIPNNNNNPNHHAPITENQGIYVQKWVRTGHAMIFRLTSHTVQVNFFDHTKVILTADTNTVTYVNKKKERQVFPIVSLMDSFIYFACQGGLLRLFIISSSSSSSSMHNNSSRVELIMGWKVVHMGVVCGVCGVHPSSYRDHWSRVERRVG
jgi:hypothetical protein